MEWKCLLLYDGADTVFSTLLAGSLPDNLGTCVIECGALMLRWLWPTPTAPILLCVDRPRRKLRGHGRQRFRRHCVLGFECLLQLVLVQWKWKRTALERRSRAQHRRLYLHGLVTAYPPTSSLRLGMVVSHWLHG